VSSVLSFYLDGTVVQAVMVDVIDDRLTVRNARTFPHDELEDYLVACPDKTCIVCCNPSSFYQDVVYLPPAASKFYDSLVRAEIRKEHSDLASFTFFHRTIGEAIIDGTLYSKIAAFSYSDELLSDYIAVFNNNGMTISHLYAAPYPIFRLAASTCPADSGLARIYIADLPGEKLILLSEKDEFEFIRKVHSPEPALLPGDIQNINMTIDYCSQTLRVRPAEAVMFNPSEISEEISALLAIPLISICPLALGCVSHDIVRDYIAPLAAVMHHIKAPDECNILPLDYVSFKQNKRILATGTMILAVLILILAGLILTERIIISDQKAEISEIRTHLSSSETEMAAYRKLDAETKTLDNQIAFLNKLKKTLNPEAALASLMPPGTASYSFKGITVKNGDGFINVHLDGTISAAGFKETQTVFEGMLERLKKIPGYSVSSDSVDVKLKTFSIEARYSGAGQQGK
jgi:hypothetical protein